MVGTAQDVTIQARAELEVRHLNEELERRNAERPRELAARNAELETFNDTASHDLRGPLRNISGFAEMLVHDAAQSLSAEHRQDCDRIVANAHRMNDILQSLLALSQTTRAEVTRRPVDLSVLFSDLHAELCLINPSRRVELVAPPAS
ncbi:MAG: hypothetical protein EXR76_15640 [Myxococcales bacterium]|nr:hypothetical protein [Myxococcales bacterium]